jgi:hypothetical protein
MTSGHDASFDARATRFRFGRGSAADYRTLGVSEAASDAEIEQAYLHLIAHHHPDRLVGLARELRRQAEKKARGIDAAYGRIRAQRQRDAQGSAVSEASPTARASDDRRDTGGLLWVAMALIAFVGVVWFAGMHAPSKTVASTATPPQSQLPAAGREGSNTPSASRPSFADPAPGVPASDVPASPPIATLPAPSLSPPVATNSQGSAPADRLMTLMPKDAPSAPRSTPAPPALSGEAALVEALRAGQLRPGTGGDFSRWAQRWSQANRRDMPARLQERTGFMTSYVIQKDFTIPEGLAGAHAVIFLLDPGVPYPHGDPGHSVVLDLSTGACMGVTCGMLLQ